jgi:predicted YcjX-like family ATPase
LAGLQDIWDAGRLAAAGVKDFATGLASPTLRLGVTGLSRSGKTVFITALVHALLKGARLPIFEAYAKGRISRCYLEPQPNDELPRFPYEQNLALLTAENRQWPESTNRISQLRLTIEYEPQGLIARNLHGGKLHVDIVDYPGEWLLDLPLMAQTYQQWSAETVAAARSLPRVTHAKAWLEHMAQTPASAAANELHAVEAAEKFTTYLSRCRESDVAQSTLPPGRFLLPGDLAGSPLLTFAPLDVRADEEFQAGSYGALMQRRYDSYVSKIVKPFFFGHFARLDRQVVLVDVLTALNAGPAAVSDLRKAFTDVLACFRLGENNLITEVFGKRVERVLFAATKADMLHHSGHDHLENILRTLIEDATSRAEATGARYDVAALSAIRATREATVQQKNESLSCIVGTPELAEVMGDTVFDGVKEAAIFPGDLPADAIAALDGRLEGKLKFLRFRPPVLKNGTFPHIRLDKTVEFLLGDRFK